MIAIDVRQINREEGACMVGLSYSSPSAFQFEATCNGKLKATRLEPYNGSTRLGNPGYPPDNSWLLYEDDGSRAPERAQARSVVGTSFTAGAHRWQIRCPEPIPGEADPFTARPAATTGVEDWRGGTESHESGTSRSGEPRASVQTSTSAPSRSLR